MNGHKRSLYGAHDATLSRPSLLLATGMAAPPQPGLFSLPVLPLRFVVKRHRASKLHTDLRIEAAGTLLSWAFYPLPSLDPAKIIHAREVGDHQIDYAMSERRIPDGSYGAGPVIVWDYGTYRPLAPFDGNEDRAVVEALQGGLLDFWVEGVNLKGGFRLELTPKGWRLTKLEDEFAAVERVRWEDRSVLTGRSLDDVEREYWDELRRLRGE